MQNVFDLLQLGSWFQSVWRVTDRLYGASSMLLRKSVPAACVRFMSTNVIIATRKMWTSVQHSDAPSRTAHLSLTCVLRVCRFLQNETTCNASHVGMRLGTCASCAPMMRSTIWTSFDAAAPALQNSMRISIGDWFVLRVMLISRVVSPTVASGRVQETFQAFPMFFCFFFVVSF